LTLPREGVVEILGCPVHRLGIESATERMQRLIEGGGRHHVALVAVHTVMSARRNRRLQALYRRASLALADGVSLLWASRILGRPIAGRVPGADLLASFARIAATKGYTFFLMGSAPQEVAASLVRSNPGLTVVGTCEPPYCTRLPEAVNRSIIKEINRAKPDVLWVGLGAPKQDRWIAENLGELEVKVAAGVGAAFDFCSGRVRRAPRWMQRLGLEWFFRFLMEPTRLFRRYFVEAAPFLPLVAIQRLREICGAGARRGPGERADDPRLSAPTAERCSE
jgi:N-acetylglucosaminyldiphosphoundecaprenol N-acetyl-beta-D-mannosaminyltransferase